eukprot:SAG11_NODE_3416_length_2461_cov_24.168925_3_plen_131_part_00
MPEISEIFEDTNVPNLTTASAVGHVARELVHDANMKMAYYANLRKQDIDNFPIGTSVRISLDGVEFNKFRQRPSKKLNPIWYGPFTVTGRPSSISVEVKIPPDSIISRHKKKYVVFNSKTVVRHKCAWSV